MRILVHPDDLAATRARRPKDEVALNAKEFAHAGWCWVIRESNLDQPSPWGSTEIKSRWVNVELIDLPDGSGPPLRYRELG